MTKKEQKHDAQYYIYAFSFIKLQIRIKDIILNWNNNSKIKTKKRDGQQLFNSWFSWIIKEK